MHLKQCYLHTNWFGSVRLLIEFKLSEYHLMKDGTCVCMDSWMCSRLQVSYFSSTIPFSLLVRRPQNTEHVFRAARRPQINKLCVSYALASANCTCTGDRRVGVHANFSTCFCVYVAISSLSSASSTSNCQLQVLYDLFVSAENFYWPHLSSLSVHSFSINIRGRCGKMHYSHLVIDQFTPITAALSQSFKIIILCFAFSKWKYSLHLQIFCVQIETWKIKNIPTEESAISI